ncbi:hypothetical protein TRFO_20783 [Tritrichomonas foetus]|uniref:Uncharacterized protein n=1 Tax=Tritrichomonas foetus TaxID=1144522 RepID=A0A1J4KF47_9EUKA|nr:hypothetical protein TRFO_20783 [Tritrichomonas foetus]|eukprot:OHT10063.1 hypothetical protein TRFO_20783 [Tritrichomonas foetus]
MEGILTFISRNFILCFISISAWIQIRSEYAKYNPLDKQNITNRIFYQDDYKVICLIFTEERWRQSAITFTSILENEPTFPYVFHLFNTIHCKDLTFRQYFIYTISKTTSKLFFHEINDTALSWPKLFNYPPIIMAKLYLSKYLPKENKVLYLDSDTLIVRPLSAIYESKYNIDKHYFAGAKDCGTYPYRWINSGFIYYNLDLIRRNNMSERSLQCVHSRGNRYYDDWCHTFCFPKRQVRILPNRFNYNVNRITNNETRKGLSGESDQLIVAHFMHRSKIVFSMKNHSEIDSITYNEHGKSLMHIYLNYYHIVNSTSKKLGIPE